MRANLLRFVLVAGGLLAAAPVWACNVPVFRFALERWEPDLYQMQLYHEGPLGKDEQVVADQLVTMVERKPAVLNLDMEREDLARLTPEDRRNFLARNGKPGLPYLKLHYPALSRIAEPAWTGPFTKASLRTVLDSPARQEIARRILAGDSAVWLFLDSGDPAQKSQDDRAAALLEAELKRLSRDLKLPKLTDDPADALKAKKVELKVAFSMLRLQRGDPAEQAFLTMLRTIMLHMDPILAERREPVALAVYGRGRALESGLLIGPGIRADNIAEVCTFLVGPCTCKVKEEIRGVDLLMEIAWDERIEGKAVEEKEVPLSGLSPVGLPEDSDSAPAAAPEVPPCCLPPSVSNPEESACCLYRNLGLGIGGAFAVLFALAVLLRGRW